MLCKGEKNMTVTIQVGTFPGRLESFAVESGTRVADVLAMAGLSVGAEQDIKMDGEVVTLNDVVNEDTSLILLSKRIKGAR
jgi:hypothetical protein